VGSGLIGLIQPGFFRSLLDVISKTLKDLFATKLNLDVPSSETELLQSGLLDSMMLVEFFVLIEKEFGVAISVDTLDLEQFGSLASIARLIRSARS
jgi:acyl carrier protein